VLRKPGPWRVNAVTTADRDRSGPILSAWPVLPGSTRMDAPLLRHTLLGGLLVGDNILGGPTSKPPSASETINSTPAVTPEIQKT